MTSIDPRAVDLLGALNGLFNGHKDDYGSDVAPPIPLMFDRVNEGRPPKQSVSRFWQLPYEILANIVEFLDSKALASLALVSSDCRQLARSKQFASVCFDFSPSSFDFMKALLYEAKVRVENHSHTTKPSIGPCLRRLTVAIDPQWMEKKYRFHLNEDFAALRIASRGSNRTSEPSLRDVLRCLSPERPVCDVKTCVAEPTASGLGRQDADAS